MWDWLSQNSTVLNVLINIALCLIWLVYLQLLLNSQKRQKRPVILISRISGGGKHAHCIVSNIGANVLHIHSLIVKLMAKDGRQIEAAIADPADVSDDKAEYIAKMSTQGPLKPGEYIDTGSFMNFIQRCIRESAQDSGDDDRMKKEDVHQLQIMVIASHGIDNTLAAAQRSFYVTENGNLACNEIETHQIRSRQEIKQMKEYLQKFH